MKNFCSQQTFLPVGLFLNFCLATVLPAQAQVANDTILTGKSLPHSSAVQVTFEPAGDGEPDKTAGGASRDSGKCSQDAITSGPSITPLMPATNRGLTTAVERPTFFVYVPETSARKAFFSLKDDKEDYYYQATLSLPRTSGIISFTLPADAPALQIGQRYQWSFVTVCGARLAVDDPRVEGEIERIALNSEQIRQLENLSLIDRAVLYGADGIWYDMLTSLAALRRSEPNNSTLAATWENLLKSVGLEAIATKSIVQ